MRADCMLVSPKTKMWVILTDPKEGCMGNRKSKVKNQK